MRQQEPPRYAWAVCFVVRGTRGRRRSVLLVECPFCTSWHTHGGPEDFTSGKRTASCHGGKYVLLAGALEGRAA